MEATASPWFASQAQSYRAGDATGASKTSPPLSATRQRFNSFQASSINDSKSLINNGAQDDDDETGELLKDPIKYAEAGSLSLQPRRATNPQILPIQRMQGLSLNTSQNVQQPISNYSSQSLMQPPPSAMSPTMLSSGAQSVQFPHGNQHFQRNASFPPVNPADQNPPCNTLYVGNLPIDTSEDELKAMFSKQRGYKRLCFRTKQNGPMCFVEFEDVSFATKALHELYGHPLHNSIKGGIRLSFSKNPLGVRSGQGPGIPGPAASNGGMPGMSGIMNGVSGPAFSSAAGPPPGLSAPPGLGPSRVQYSAVQNPMTNGNGIYGGATFAASGGWNTPNYTTTSTASLNGTASSSYMGSLSSGSSVSMNGAVSPKYTSPLLNGTPASLSGAGSPTYGNATPTNRGLSNSGFPPYMMGR